MVCDFKEYEGSARKFGVTLKAPVESNLLNCGEKVVENDASLKNIIVFFFKYIATITLFDGHLEYFKSCLLLLIKKKRRTTSSTI